MRKNKRKNIVYVFTSCRKSGPIQVMYNLIANLDRNQFEPIIITIYKEQEDSELEKFQALGVTHYFCPLRKIDIITGNTRTLYNLISELQPDVIHTTGVFPDNAVSRMNFGCQFLTLHNFMRDDYLTKFGPLQGRVLEALQMYAVRRAKKVVTCSRSLAVIYKQRKGLTFDWICNGVDTQTYSCICDEERSALRKKLRLPLDKEILVYAGQFVPRKNQRFVLQAFADGLLPETLYLLLLGAGPDLNPLREKYKQLVNVDFRGMVTNVNEYLQCADLYISVSKSEGLPNGVLEAMATGLPVVLSDIPQHHEIVDNDPACGRLFALDDEAGFSAGVKEMLAGDIAKARAVAQSVVAEHYDARVTSQVYQAAYLELARQSQIEKQELSH